MVDREVEVGECPDGVNLCKAVVEDARKIVISVSIQ
jgi:hypothetical protein